MEDSFNNWKICECIGAGAFGNVYRIIRTDYGHTYESALKVLEIPQHSSEVETVRQEGLSEVDITSYFESIVKDIVNEFVLMSKLKGNSHIVSYEDHEVVKKKDSFGWEIYIRMELLTPLYSYIQQGFMTVSEVVKMGIHLCKALELCKSHHIIHRDIKPENIFVSSNGDFKLGDFGIARELEKTSGDFSKKGTKSYMAPEVYKGMEYDYTVDIYSLGIVLYRCLNNNRLPFYPAAPNAISYSDKENATLLRMSGKEMPNPCNASAELSRIVLKACAYIPSERYNSAREMREDLEKIYEKICEKEKIDAQDNNTVYMWQASSGNFNNTTNEQLVVNKEDTTPLEQTVMLSDESKQTMGDTTQKSELEDETVLLKESGCENSIGIAKNMRKLLVGIIVGVLTIAIGIGVLCWNWNGTSEKIATKQSMQAESKRKEMQGEKVSVTENLTEAPIITATPFVTPHIYDVPDVAGRTIETATKLLEKQGLHISVVEKYHASAEKGKVYRQSIKKGTSVQEGQKITIYVSLGTKSKKVSAESQTIPKVTTKPTTAKVSTKATEKPVVKETEKPVTQATKKPKRSTTVEKDSTEITVNSEEDSIQDEIWNPSADNDDNTENVEWNTN